MLPALASASRGPSERTAPLGELRRLAESGASGQFLHVGAALEARVFLQAGRVAWATASNRPILFGRRLRERCGIDEPTFRQILVECAEARRPVAEALVEHGLADLGEVRCALFEQVAQVLDAMCAEPAARTVFLERADAPAPVALELGWVLPREAMPERSAVAASWLAEVEGASWVDVYDRDARVDAAPNDATRPLPAALTSTFADGATLVTVRRDDGAIVGTPLGLSRQSLWCGVSASSTLGAVVATLGEILPAAPIAVRSAGDVAFRLEGPPSVVLDALVRGTPDVLAAVVVEGGAPVAAVGRGPGGEAQLRHTLARRREALAAARQGASSASIAIGAPDAWWFGTTLPGDRAELWLVLERTTTQGLGWAHLGSATRALAR